MRRVLFARAIASCYFASGGSGKCEHRTNTKGTASCMLCISSLFPVQVPGVITGANHGLVYDDSDIFFTEQVYGHL